MANEITATSGLSVTKDGGTYSVSVSKVSTLTGTKKAGWTQTIGTSYEIVAVPDDLSNETSGGATYLSAKNLDNTNFVEFSYQANDTGRFSKLKAGEGFLIPVSHWGQVAAASVPCYAKANTANVDVAFVVTGT